MATGEEVVQRLATLEGLVKDIHERICGNGEAGLTERMRGIELQHAVLKKEMEIRQNWLTTIGSAIAIALSSLAAYFTNR